MFGARRSHRRERTIKPLTIMHSIIIKLSQTPDFEDKLDMYDISTEEMSYFLMDYCGDERDDDEVFNILEKMLEGVAVVNREKRTLTLLDGAVNVVEQEMQEVKQMIVGITPSDLATDSNFARFKIKEAMRRFRDFSTLLYVDYSLCFSMDFVSEFLNDFYGKTLYIINGIDYHY